MRRRTRRPTTARPPAKRRTAPPPPLALLEVAKGAGDDVVRRPRRDGGEIVDQRPRGRPADQPKGGDQRQQGGEDREDRVVGEGGGPVPEVVVPEGDDGPPQRRAPGPRLEVLRAVGHGA